MKKIVYNKYNKTKKEVIRMIISTLYNIGDHVKFVSYRTKKPAIVVGEIKRISVYKTKDDNFDIRYIIEYAFDEEIYRADFWECDLLTKEVY
ncbi:MAG: hypothetical protein J6W84_06455 [Bacteroidales bacterium]|nr:hypothetical protein [Bacteroidales bacterium]